MSRVSVVDRSAGDEEGHDPHTRVCKLASVQHRRDSDWPFLYSVTDRGITINKPPLRKKGGNTVEKIGEALW